MMKNFTSKGAVLDHVASADVTGGAPVAMGDSVGVAVADIAAGNMGAVAVEGIYEVTKVSGTAWTQGQAVDFDASAGAFTVGLSTQSGDVTSVGIAAADAPAGAAVGLVKLANPGSAA